MAVVVSVYRLKFLEYSHQAFYVVRLAAMNNVHVRSDDRRATHHPRHTADENTLHIASHEAAQ